MKLEHLIFGLLVRTVIKYQSLALGGPQEGVGPM
jgi:hypothetical protein